MTAQPILIALETNAESNHICAHGRAIARANQQPFRLMSVVEPPSYLYPEMELTSMAAYAREWQHRQLCLARSFLARLADGIHPKHVIVDEGHPVSRITDTAETLDASLIVMGLHNRSGLRRLLGSTTHGVLNEVQRSLLAVHPDAAAPPYRKVLIAVDTSEVAADVLAYAKPYADSAEQVTVLTVTAPISELMPAPDALHSATFPVTKSLPELRADLRAEVVQQQSLMLSELGYHSQVLEVVAGKPRDEIIKAANHLAADLIIMGTNNRNMLGRILLGSTTHGVLNDAPCSVLVHSC